MVFEGAPLPTRPALRLTMVADRTRHGALHGAWWPHGLDLAAELPTLVAGLDAWLGIPGPSRSEHVTRLLMRLSEWDAVPARVDIAGRRVRMAWSGAVDAHGVGVTSSSGDHLDLLIIPPDAPVRLADAAAGQAIDTTNTLAPTAILTSTMPAFLYQSRSRRRMPSSVERSAPRSNPLRLLDDGDPDDTDASDGTGDA